MNIIKFLRNLMIDRFSIFTKSHQAKFTPTYYKTTESALKSDWEAISGDMQKILTKEKH